MNGPGNNLAQVDVLAVLDEYAEIVGDDHDVGVCNCDIAVARAAVAELVAADREYDEAHVAYANAATGKPRNDAWERVQVAVNRRRAALRPFNGGAS